MCANKSKRLTVLSEAEKHALYDLPDFDDFQRAEFFAMTEKEHAIVFQRGYQMMLLERQKRATLEPMNRLAKLL